MLTYSACIEAQQSHAEKEENGIESARSAPHGNHLLCLCSVTILVVAVDKEL